MRSALRPLGSRPAARCRITRAAGAFLAILVLGCGRQAGPLPPEALIAHDRIAHVDLATGRTLRQRLLPAPTTDMALTDDASALAVATRRGAAFLSVPALEVVWTEDLGILDAVELSPDEKVAYFLIHPGESPDEAPGEHRVLEVAFPGGEHRREARLDARSYDLLVERPGGALFVTDLIGRTVHRIDPATFAVTHHTIGLGQPPELEPLGAFMRLILPGPRTGELVVIEDSRDAARLWRWEPAQSRPSPAEPKAERLEPHPLPGVRPPILGGGRIGGTSMAASARNDNPPGGGAREERGLWLHTRSHFLRLGADFGVAASLALTDADSAPGYRFAAADHATCVLLGPAPPARGMPQSQMVWIDLAQGLIGGRRRLEVRTGPLVLLPRGAVPVAAGRGRSTR
jgi:hypothetical protein